MRLRSATDLDTYPTEPDRLPAQRRAYRLWRRNAADSLEVLFTRSTLEEGDEWIVLLCAPSQIHFLGTRVRSRLDVELVATDLILTSHLSEGWSGHGPRAIIVFWVPFWISDDAGLLGPNPKSAQVRNPWLLRHVTPTRSGKRTSLARRSRARRAGSKASPERIAIAALLTCVAIATGLFSEPLVPATGHSIDIGPFGVRSDPRSPPRDWY